MFRPPFSREKMQVFTFALTAISGPND